jgi:uncharacterized protein with HEPN domain
VRSPRERLRDIIDAIDAIDRYASRGRESFDHDELVQVWIVRHHEIVGEAANRVPAELRARVPSIPWAQVIGMRHVLAHGYFAMNADLIWAVVERDLPPLREAVARLLADLETTDA